METREEWFDRMENSISATRLSGGLIAIISLVVGGIGITNIMLASITERVREIGIRLAVGARGRDIFMQILVESISVAFIGGLIGVVAGVALIQLLIFIAPTENAPVMTMSSVVLSVSFAVLAGIVSGIYPAMRASRLDPIGPCATSSARLLRFAAPQWFLLLPAFALLAWWIPRMRLWQPLRALCVVLLVLYLVKPE